jgi:hypothetical protein
MGQAKRRGTFEQRAELAIARNAALEKQIGEGHALYLTRRRIGSHRLAVTLLMAGLLKVNPAMKPE